MTAGDVRKLEACEGQPFGLVLSGGGARGAFQVGVWEVLRHDHRGLGGAPAVVSGTSAGSINAALIAAGLAPEAMLEFWVDLGRRPPVIANDVFFSSLERALAKVIATAPFRRKARRRRSARIMATLIKRHAGLWPSNIAAMVLQYVLTARFDDVSRMLDGITTSYLFSTAPARERLIDAIGGRFIRSETRLAINAVDLHSGQVVRYVNFRPHKHSEADSRHYRYAPLISVDMVLASASIPLLFNPVRIDGQDIWDGGLLVNTPLAPAVALGARRIIPVLVTSGAARGPARALSMGGAFERLADAFLENAYNTDRKLLIERNRLARSQPDLGLSEVELYEAIRPASSATFDVGSYLFFEPDALTEMYRAGQRAARRWLDAGPKLDGPHGPQWSKATE